MPEIKQLVAFEDARCFSYWFSFQLQRNIPVYVVINGINGYYHLPVKGIERIPNHRQWDSFGKLIIDHAPFLNYLDRLQELMVAGR